MWERTFLAMMQSCDLWWSPIVSAAMRRRVQWNAASSRQFTRVKIPIVFSNHGCHQGKTGLLSRLKDEKECIVNSVAYTTQARTHRLLALITIFHRKQLLRETERHFPRKEINSPCIMCTYYLEKLACDVCVVFCIWGILRLTSKCTFAIHFIQWNASVQWPKVWR